MKSPGGDKRRPEFQPWIAGLFFAARYLFPAAGAPVLRKYYGKSSAKQNLN